MTLYARMPAMTPDERSGQLYLGRRSPVSAAFAAATGDAMPTHALMPSHLPSRCWPPRCSRAAPGPIFESLRTLSFRAHTARHTSGQIACRHLPARLRGTDVEHTISFCLKATPPTWSRRPVDGTHARVIIYPGSAQAFLASRAAQSYYHAEE